MLSTDRLFEATTDSEQPASTHAFAELALDKEGRRRQQTTSNAFLNMMQGGMAAKMIESRKLRSAQETKQLSRQDWVDYGIRLLGEFGPDAVRIDRLCAGLGVTKGSFYWHFGSRAGLLEQMLKYWEYKETQNIIDEIEAEKRFPQEALNRLFEKANAGVVNFRAEMAVRQWALQDKQVAAVVRAVDERRLDFLYRQFKALSFPEAEIKMRARLLYSLIFGEALIQQPEQRGSRRTRWHASLRFLLAR